MSPLTREEKLKTFGELSKHPKIQTGDQFAESLLGRARILIDHPASSRDDWTIVGQSAIAGFWNLEISTPIGRDVFTERMSYQRFELTLPDSQFQRIQ